MPIAARFQIDLDGSKIFPIIGAIGMIVLFYPLLLLLNQPGIRRIRPGCSLRMGGPRYRAGGLPDHSGRAVPGLRPGIRHRVFASAGDRRLRWHRPADRRRIVGAGHPTWVAIYMIVIVALCLIVYFTLPEDRQSDQAGHCSSRRPRGTGRREAGGLQDESDEHSP